MGKLPLATWILALLAGVILALAGCERLAGGSEPKEVEAGATALRQGDKTKATEQFEAAIARSHNDWRTYAYIINALGDAHSPEVYTYLDRGLKAVPKGETEGRIQLYMIAGQAYDRLGDHNAFISAADEAHGLAPDRYETMNGLAYAYAEANQNLDRAVDLATAALAKVKEQKAGDEAAGVVEDTLGWAYFQQHNYNQAVLHLASAAEHAPSYYEIQGHLGLAYHARGMDDEAKTALTRAKRLAEAHGVNDDNIARYLVDVQRAIDAKHTSPVSNSPPP